MVKRITTSRKWKIFLYTQIILFGLITFAIFVGVVGSCRPLGLLWDQTLEGSCDIEERTVLLYIQGGMCAGQVDAG